VLKLLYTNQRYFISNSVDQFWGDGFFMKFHQVIEDYYIYFRYKLDCCLGMGKIEYWRQEQTSFVNCQLLCKAIEQCSSFVKWHSFLWASPCKWWNANSVKRCHSPNKVWIHWSISQVRPDIPVGRYQSGSGFWIAVLNASQIFYEQNVHLRSSLLIA